MHTLLFLCTGNYYRSRFAEELFNALARPLALPWAAESRALAIELGYANVGPISAAAVQALAARGVALAAPARMPAQAYDHDFAAARRIIALHEAEHRPMLAGRFPAWAPRVEYWHVPDVGDLPPAAALERIGRQVEALVAELQTGTPDAGA